MKCDELFVYCKTTCDPQGLYYSKSEVDEAIAELKDGSELDAKTIAALKSEADKVIAWHKYRRCLAMAKWCERKRIDAADYRIPREKWEFYDKWHKRWLKLAEKFKPNKETK